MTPDESYSDVSGSAALRRLSDKQEQAVKAHGPADASWWGVLAMAGAARSRADELERGQ